MGEALNPERQIEEKLHRFIRQLKRCNGQGLLDLARQSEDVVCRLLNLALGWDLVNLNKEWPNCPAIDLADKGRRLCVQVTAVRTAAKATASARRLKQYHSGKYDHLIIFYLLGKPGKLPSLMEGHTVEAWDMSDLATTLGQAPEDVRQAALTFLRTLEDRGFFEDRQELSKADKYFVPERTLMRDSLSGQALLVRQQNRVRLTAFLPQSPGEQLCCKIEFARRDTEGGHITFDQRELLGHLLCGHHGPLEARGFMAVLVRQRDYAALQLGSCRYITDIDTAEQLCLLLDDLQEEYHAVQCQLAEMMGTDNFICPPTEDWTQPLCRLPNWLWEELWADARANDAIDGDGDWALFDRCAPPGVIRLLRQSGETCSCGIVAELKSNREGDTCLVCWRRGMFSGVSDWEGFEDGRKWRADQTLTWLLTCWLPHLAKKLFCQAYPEGLRGKIGRWMGWIPSQMQFTAQLQAQVEDFRKRKELCYYHDHH